MRRIGDMYIRGSTMVELLVLMIVAGIVFLAVIDGMTLGQRYFDIVAENIDYGQTQYEGYCRIEALINQADSVTCTDEEVTIWMISGTSARLRIEDSSLLVEVDMVRDTLLHHVAWGRNVWSQDESVRIDTLHILVHSTNGLVALHFPQLLAPADKQSQALADQEELYHYEESPQPICR